MGDKMNIDNMHQKMEFTREEIASRVKELGAEIAKDYKDKNLLVVPLLKGAFIFAADLIREIDLKVAVEFMTTSSYENAFENSGKVDIKTKLEKDVSDFDVLIVDDIVDSAITLKTVTEYVRSLNPKSLKTCTFLDKPERRQVEFVPDYCGYEVENNFIVGYGLNYGDHYRNIPYIFSVKPKED